MQSAAQLRSIQDNEWKLKTHVLGTVQDQLEITKQTDPVLGEGIELWECKLYVITEDDIRDIVNARSNSEHFKAVITSILR